MREMLFSIQWPKQSIHILLSQQRNSEIRNMDQGINVKKTTYLQIKNWLCKCIHYDTPEAQT